MFKKLAVTLGIDLLKKKLSGAIAPEVSGAVCFTGSEIEFIKAMRESGAVQLDGSNDNLSIWTIDDKPVGLSYVLGEKTHHYVL